MENKKIILEDISNIINEKLPFERFYKKTVLISGANGYVPSYFVHSFIALNEKQDARIHVIALCRSERKAKERFSDYLNRDDFELVIQDVCNPINVDREINIFIHAASPAGIKKRFDDPVNTFLANVKGAENMLNLAINNPCESFLFMSSVDIYGRMNSDEPLKEDMSGFLDPLNVRNVYSCGKRATESLCIAYVEKYQLPIFIVRPFQIIGPGLEMNDGRLHIDFISQILQNNRIVLKSDGSAVRSFMYITDAIKAMFYVMLYGEKGQAVNIVTESGEKTVKELAEIIADEVAGKTINIEYDYSQRKSLEVTGALSSVVGDSTKLQSLGWKNQYSVRDGMRRMMEFYGIELR